MKIIRYAKMASEAWGSFIKADSKRKRICNHFHLRPTNSGVTIISTLNSYEMRGTTGIKEKERLSFILEKINRNYEVLTSLNEKKKNKAMEDLGFPQRKKIKDRNLEEKIQATMINTMGRDRNLKGKLGSRNNILFVASELIF